MKKISMLVLALILALSLCVPAFAQGKNYSTKDWDGSLFPGASGAKQEDGTYVYTGIGNVWYGATVDVFQDLIALAGDKTDMDITIAFWGKVKFKEGADLEETTVRPMLRAYPTDAKKDLPKTPDEWLNQLSEAIDGEAPIIVSDGANLLTLEFPEGRMTLVEDEWTLYEVNLQFCAKELNPEWFTEWKFTWDTVSDYESIESITVADFGIYLTSEYETPAAPSVGGNEPTAAPTAAPTAEPTATPEVTPAPATDAPATDAPATDAPATDAPAEPTAAPEEKKGCGSVLALGLLAAVIPAAVIAKKKEN